MRWDIVHCDWCRLLNCIVFLWFLPFLYCFLVHLSHICHKLELSLESEAIAGLPASVQASFSVLSPVSFWRAPNCFSATAVYIYCNILPAGVLESWVRRRLGNPCGGGIVIVWVYQGRLLWREPKRCCGIIYCNILYIYAYITRSYAYMHNYITISYICIYCADISLYINIIIYIMFIDV